VRYLFILSILLQANSLLASNTWTSFRGTDNDGWSNAADIPTAWSEEENIKWKTAIHDLGWSSPVIMDDQIWVTSATKDGKKMYAVCVSLESGEILHDILVLENEKVQWKNASNSYATPTPVIEKESVYADFGTYGTVCIDTKSGNIVWKRTDISSDRVPHGPASSPIVYKNLLIVHHEASDILRITALDKRTGETVWQVHRPEELYKNVKTDWRKSHATPIIITVNEKDQLVSSGARVCQAFDPQTGKEIWRVAYGIDSTVACPLFWNGLVYINTGLPTEDGKTEMWAVRPDGTGNVTETHVVWKYKDNVAEIPTPVVKEGLIFMINKNGDTSCIDAKTGGLIWMEKLEGRYNSSPAWIGGNVYFTNSKGKTTVIKAKREFHVVADNQLEGQFVATPSVVGKSLILRSDSHLYRIENN
jgi:outer membrane protein assembly factor BamB